MKIQIKVKAEDFTIEALGIVKGGREEVFKKITQEEITEIVIEARNLIELKLTKIYNNHDNKKNG